MRRKQIISGCKPTDLRFAWVHIPKTGSSIVTALFHAANSSLPSSAQLPVCSSDGHMLKAEVDTRNVSFAMSCRQIMRRGKPAQACQKLPLERCIGGQAELSFLNRFPLDTWFRCAFWEHWDGNIGSHSEITASEYERMAGKFVGMFRAPQQRTTSSYLWFRSSFPAEVRPDASEYARRVQGTATKMLAGQADGMACSSAFGSSRRAPRQPDGDACDRSVVPNVSEAVLRLRRGFAFVGLTEHWALSVCLLHAIYGGECLPVEFENARPGGTRAADFWSRKLLAETEAAVASVGDPYDEAVYAEARRRFWRDVRSHELSAKRCAALCPGASQRFLRSTLFP